MSEQVGMYHIYNGIEDNIDTDEQRKIEIQNFVSEQLKAQNLSLFIGSGCSVPAVPLMSTTMKDILSKHDNILNCVKKFLGYQKIETFLERIQDENDKIKYYIIEKNKANTHIGEVDSFIEQEIQKKSENEDAEIEYTIKEKLKEYYTSFSDIEMLLTWIQSGIKFNPNDNELQEVFKNLKTEFLKTIPELGAYDKTNEVFNRYVQFYQAIFSKRSSNNSKVSIFTTNYDLFNEYGLENNGISYTTGFENTIQRKFDINQFKYRLVDDTNRYKDKWQPVFKEANLYKIHGSINWVSENDGILRQKTNSVGTDENVIIYPTILKHKETAQSPYSELFREFANCLQKQNTTLIMIGYGFGDDHINNIISQNLKNNDFTLIIFGDKSENKLNEFYEKYQESSGLHLIGGDAICKNGNSTKVHYFEYIVNNLLNKPEKDYEEE